MIPKITLKIVVLLRCTFAKAARDLMPGFHELGSSSQVKFALVINFKNFNGKLSLFTYFSTDCNESLSIFEDVLMKRTQVWRFIAA